MIPASSTETRAHPAHPGTGGILQKYAIACGATLAIFGLRLLLAPILEEGAPLLAFVLAVMIAARYGGIGPGLFATALSLALGTVFFILPEHSSVGLSVSEQVRLVLFTGVGGGITLLSESLRRSSETTNQLLSQVEESARRQRVFIQEILATVTDGRLRLCDSADDLPALPANSGETVPLSLSALAVVRRQVRRITAAVNLEEMRGFDFLTAVHEAAMNAVVHGGGGEVYVAADPNGNWVRARVSDQGTGIADHSLHRATLERGFTTAEGFGHGFPLILQTADRVWLLTGASGTTIVLEQSRVAPEPSWALFNSVLPAAREA